MLTTSAKPSEQLIPKGSSRVIWRKNFSTEVEAGDESPVSVFNGHSAMMSHPSSASTSMEHPVPKLNHHLPADSVDNSNNINALRISNKLVKVGVSEFLIKSPSLKPMISPWPTKRMGWYHLQEYPNPHVEIDCIEDQTFNTESASTDQEEGISSILCRDQDEDSLIDFFPSASRAGSIQRVQSYEKINALINDDNPKKGPNIMNVRPGGHQWKGMPSKWDDAERWLMKTPQKNINEVMMGKAGGLVGSAAKMAPEPSTKDKHTNVHEVKRIGNRGSHASMREAGTEVDEKRDMATQSTPVVSSRCDSPDNTVVVSAQKTSPARHNTPARRSVSCQARRSCTTKGDSTGLNLLEVESCHLAKLELARDLPLGTSSTWVLEGEGPDESTTCLTTNHDYQNAIMNEHQSAKFNILEARASAWEDVERAKLTAKCDTTYPAGPLIYQLLMIMLQFKREEAKIEAWESLHRAEADAELRKLEVKLEKLRFEGRGKILGKLSAARRRAQEMLANAGAHKAEHLARVSERANQIRKNGQLPGTLNLLFR